MGGAAPLRRLTLLHTNDIHGREKGIARVATLVERIRAETLHPVVYVDAGDVEESSRRLSNLTKGAAMHRLLSAAGCAAHTAGNAAWQRYGPQELAQHAEAAAYPMLLANFRDGEGGRVAGMQDAALLDAGGIAVGAVGVTAPMFLDDDFDFGVTSLPEEPLVRALAAGLRSRGAELVLLLSHLGLERDRELAAELYGAVDLIVGAHSHDVLPEGEWVAGIPIVQAGCYAEYVGRVELELDGGVRVVSMSVVPVSVETPEHRAVTAAAAAIEPEIEELLGAVIGQLAAPLELSGDRECRIASWLADVLRERMAAEVGLVCAGAGFDASLGAGPLTRGALWGACSSTANPGVTAMSGEQLLAVVRRGTDPVFAATTAGALRGAPRGLLHLSGAELRDGVLLVGGEPVEPTRSYRVAGGDWELAHYGGYVERDWKLQVTYDFPTIMREALEEHLSDHPVVEPPLPRLHGALC